MSNLKYHILAKVMRRLDQMGFSYQVNRPVNISTHVSGYKRVQVDIAILNKKENMVVALYLGVKKERRYLKYKLLKVPTFYFFTEDIEEEFERMVKGYAASLF